MRKLLIIAAAVAVAAWGCSPEAPKTEEHKVFYALGAHLNKQLSVFDLTPEEFRYVQQGMADSASGKKLAVEPEDQLRKLGELAQSRMERATEKQKEKSKAYLEKAAAEKGFGRILLGGHIGKLVKLGIGITNTHSDQGDGRMETLIACALEAGAPIICLQKLLSCATTDAAVELLHAAGWLKPSMNVLTRRVEATLLSRVPERVEIGFICFSHAASCRGIIAKSENADRLARCWRRKEGNNHL